jgi:hypothetical protein
MPQEKQCRASVNWCNELSRRDGFGTDEICLSTGNGAYLCIPLREVGSKLMSLSHTSHLVLYSIRAWCAMFCREL